MSTNYPVSADAFSIHADNVNEKIAAANINNIQDAVVAIENTVGFPASLTTTDKSSIVAAINENKTTATAALPKAGGTMTGALTTPYIYVNPQDGVNEGGEIRLKGAGANPDVILDNLSGKLRVSGYQAWDDNRLRVHSSGNYIEWNKGGVWLPVGGAVTVASDTIQQSFDTEYIKAYTQPNDKFLVAKFTPKGSGEVKIKFDVKSTNNTFTEVTIGKSYSSAEDWPAFNAPSYALTPLGTLVFNPVTFGVSSSGAYPNSPYTTKELIFTVKEPTPIYVFMNANFVSSSAPTDYAYIKNVRMYYDYI